MNALFPDCRQPDDCECRKRGYEHEADSCRIPLVKRAIETLFFSDDDLLEWSDDMLMQFVAAAILVAEGTVPPLPEQGEGLRLVPWAIAHVSPQVFAAAVKRAEAMPPSERGQHLRKAIDGATDA
jgi:hypothetical protein